MKPCSRYVTALIVGLGILVFALPALADSLWVDRSGVGGMVSDRRACQVGDIVTIIISEQTSTSNNAKTSNGKQTSMSSDAGTGIFHFLAAASAGMSDSFSATGSKTNANVVTARITVTVTEVKPNGNLVLTGTQSIKVDGEEQKIILTGTVRPENIMADNTVLSSSLADAKITIDGKGPLASKQRQGILSRLFDWLF